MNKPTQRDQRGSDRARTSVMATLSKRPVTIDRASHQLSETARGKSGCFEIRSEDPTKWQWLLTLSDTSHTSDAIDTALRNVIPRECTCTVSFYRPDGFCLTAVRIYDNNVHRASRDRTVLERTNDLDADGVGIGDTEPPRRSDVKERHRRLVSVGVNNTPAYVVEFLRYVTCSRGDLVYLNWKSLECSYITTITTPNWKVFHDSNTMVKSAARAETTS